MTSVKRRLHHVLNELSAMGTEPDEKAAGNVATQLSIIKAAFKDSQNYPMCCFRYDAEAKVICDVNGPLTLEQFMQKCRVCQAQMKKILVNLQTD